MDLGAKGQAGEPALPPPAAQMFPWRWVWLAFTVAVLVGVTVAYLLWGETTAEHRDAFDTGWKSSAAVLAILATFVSVDRFRLSQREHHRQLVVDHLTQRDIIARQITELSAKASEQLGSDKAAVRIGGLTDLERLAQSHPELRQTVVDRVCAYLRAPFQPPPDSTAHRRPEPGEQPDTADDEVLTPEETAARRLEFDVRRTAQQILTRHLHWPADVSERPSLFWEGINLDLRDATLVEFTLEDCRIADADFRNARLHRFALFTRTTFGLAVFLNATFTGDANFRGVNFTGFANFTGASFAEFADFRLVTFGGVAGFPGAAFLEGAAFAEAAFAGQALFSRAAFGDAVFDRATFAGNASFHATIFSEDASFPGATFLGEADFERATFNEIAWFGEATNIRAHGIDPEIIPSGARTTPWVTTSDVHIPATRFDGTLSFEGASVADPVQAHSWPPPWRPEPNPDEPGGPYTLQAHRKR